MVVYGITLVPLAEEHMDEDPTLISPLYAKDAAFDGLARQSTDQLHLLIDLRPDRGYFPNTANSFFIADNPEDGDAERRKLERVGLYLNDVDGSQYLGAYLGPREELEVWVRPKVEA